MAQQPVNFDPSSGDDTSAALKKLANNCTDLDARVTVAKATADGAMPKTGGTFTGAVASNGNMTAGGGTMQVGAGTGRYTVITYDGTVTNQTTTNPTNAGGFSSLVLKASGNYGGGIGLKDGTNNIGFWSNNGDLIVGYGTNDDTLTEQAKITRSGFLQVKGNATRSGVSGGYGGNTYSIYWDGSASLYIDATKIGNFAFATSDPRLKRDVVYVDTEADGDADIEKVLAGRPVTWYQKATGIFGDDGVQRRSFLSPEMQDIDPLFAPGDRHAETEDGGIVPLNLNTDAIISVLWGALRREVQLRRDLEARVAALETPATAG